MHKYYRIFFVFIFVISFVAVAASFIMEHYFLLSPCKLCYYQRWTYMGLLGLCTLGYFDRKHDKIVISLVVIALTFGTGTAFTHMAIEMEWIKLDLSCTSNFSRQPTSIEDFKSLISDKEIVPCDMPRYKFIGISIAGWNFIYSSVILFFAGIVSYAFIPKVRYEEKFEHGDHLKPSKPSKAKKAKKAK